MLRTRASIAGLMVAVLVAAIWLAAVRSRSERWASVLLLLTSGVLAFGAIGAICGRKNDRAWWIGFAVIGWGYLSLVSWAHRSISWDFHVATTALCGPYGMIFNGWLPQKPCSVNPRDSFTIDRCLASLVLATLGGILARRFFGSSSAGAVRAPADDRPRTRGRSWRNQHRPTMIGIVVLTLFACTALAGARIAPGPGPARRLS